MMQVAPDHWKIPHNITDSQLKQIRTELQEIMKNPHLRVGSYHAINKILNLVEQQ